jgi:shikimate dehydrogenase
MRSVSGTTRLAGIVGDPLEHTLSPTMHNAAYEAMDLDWVYVPLLVRGEEDLRSVIGALRVLPFVGVNVTMPYKQAMLLLCDEVAETASLAGAVNTVQCVGGRLVGYNTDGRGIVEALSTEADFDPAGRDIAIVGAGGAAAGALVAFALAGARRIIIVNRSEERGRALAERVGERLRGVDILSLALSPGAAQSVEGADLVLNATPIGMKAEDPSPIPVAWLRSGQVVADMVYGAQPTTLVRAARDAGAVALDGLGMLVCQGAMSIDIWHGDATARAPRDLMRAAALAALGDGA